MRVSDLFQLPPPIEVTLHNGGVINIQRRPWSNVLDAEVNAMTQGEDERFHSFRARQVMLFLAAWDVEDEHGNAVPPSYDLLCEMDLRDILTIDAAMGADFLPPRRTTSPESGERPSPTES